MTTAWIVLGPPDHGVVILAESLAANRGDADLAVRARTADELRTRIDAGDGLRTAHVHFTDQLFGPDCTAAALAYEALAADLARADTTLSVTLHDLPLDPDDPTRYRRRADAYAAVVAATTGTVIVSSSHEAVLLGAVTPNACPVVIPLPIDRAPWSAEESPEPTDCPTSADVNILGFLYPGKGHTAALEALSVLPDGVGLTALGSVAEGHAELADALRARAAQLGRRFSVAQWIPEAELPTRLRAAGIPLVGHERLSASGSIGSWLSAGRRPLVPDIPYTRELIARLPGTVTPYPQTPAGLRAALVRAYQDPASTWLERQVLLGPSTAEVAAAYRHAVSTTVGR